MKQTINFSQFVDGFQCRKENFSYAGLKALFEHLEEYEDSTAEELEFDPIGLCCDFSEHGTALECVKDNGYDTEEEARQYLSDNTNLIEFDGGIIIQNF